MSILYKIFGIPRTFDEFVDKIKERGVDKVDVVPAVSCRIDWGGSSFYRYSELLAGEIRFKTPGYKHYVFSPTANAAAESLDRIKKTTLKAAVEIAERLVNLGFKVTINEKSITEADKTVIRGLD